MKINQPLIYLITDGTIEAQNYKSNSSKLFDLIEVAVSLNIFAVQIREKKLPINLLFDLTKQIVKIKQNSTTKIIVNDRLDVAFAARADGVHLTSNSISTDVIRRTSPQDFVIGASTHSVPEVRRAKNDGANFAVFSPIFYTPNKGSPKGVEKLSNLIQNMNDFPVIALGGINLDNFHEVLEIGACGIAAIRGFNDINLLLEFVTGIRKFVKKDE